MRDINPTHYASLGWGYKYRDTTHLFFFSLGSKKNSSNPSLQTQSSTGWDQELHTVHLSPQTPAFRNPPAPALGHKKLPKLTVAHFSCKIWKTLGQSNANNNAIIILLGEMSSASHSPVFASAPWARAQQHFWQTPHPEAFLQAAFQEMPLVKTVREGGQRGR